MTEYEKNLEIHRLNFIAVGIINKLQEVLPKLKDTFLHDSEYAESKKTLNRLHSETLALDKDVMDRLNGGSNHLNMAPKQTESESP